MKKFLMLLVSALFALPSFAASDVVKASSFGFDKIDATKCLQKAIDSGAKKVIVDNTGSPWIVNSIVLRSDLELVFADGVVVRAIKGAFRQRNEKLFSGVSVKNVTMRGEGTAVLEMLKKDYQDQPRYEWSEWRHCISFRGSDNIVIRDLTLKSSGGDGIYISNAGTRPCRGVLIENVIADDHHRQGISIISAVDLLIRNCKFINTSGTAPQCGIDIEPNGSTDQLINNVIENCEFYGNAAGGISVFLPYLTTPVSIIFRNCKVYNNSYGIRTNSHVGKNGEIQQGYVRFENCHIYNTGNSTLSFAGQQKNGMTVTLKDCILDNRGSSGAAITFNNARVSSNVTGIFFENCTLYSGKRPLYEVVQRTGFGIGEIKGDLKIINDKGNVSKANWAALSKQYPEDKQLQSFDFADVKFENLRALNAEVKNPKPQSWRIRNSGSCMLYTTRPGTYNVRFTVDPVRPKRIIRYQVLVKTANNTIVEKFTVTSKDYTRKIKSNGNRLYIFEITGAGQTVDVFAPYPGFGFLVQNRLPFFRCLMKDMYFYVQPGVKEFRVEVMGTGKTEWVTANLRNAEGKIVDSCVKVPGTAILRGKRADASKGEVWLLQVRGKEDHSIRLSAPLIPVLSPNKDQVFTCVK